MSTPAQLQSREIPREPAPRRIVAIVLSEILCELALSQELPTRAAQRRRSGPFGVMLTERATVSGERAASSSAVAQQASLLLDAVNGAAQRFGVYTGQSIAEASTFVAQLKVYEVSSARLQASLARVAEIALGFGSPVAVETQTASTKKVADTVWVDVTGSAHLMGGEEALLLELERRVSALGHVVRLGVASGPLVAQALARWANPELELLPLIAFPIETDAVTWLARLGVLTVAEFRALPAAAVTARLGAAGAQLIDWCAGSDTTQLVPYQPPRVLVEETAWEEPLDGVQPLLFVLRGLAARISARLLGRGEAAQALVLVVQQDASIAALNGVAAVTRLHFDLATPLWREDELRRVVSSRLERLTLLAPSLGLRLEVPAITTAKARQLELSRVAAGLLNHCAGDEALPVLLVEIAADIGKDRVGVLQVKDAHRPEARSGLATALALETDALRTRGKKSTRREGSQQLACEGADVLSAPTRFLPTPLPLRGPLAVGSSLAINCEVFAVEALEFAQRIMLAEWWTDKPSSRDYWRLWLGGAAGSVEAWVYIDRSDGQYYLQAISD